MSFVEQAADRLARVNRATPPDLDLAVTAFNQQVQCFIVYQGHVGALARCTIAVWRDIPEGVSRIIPAMRVPPGSVFQNPDLEVAAFRVAPVAVDGIGMGHWRCGQKNYRRHQRQSDQASHLIFLTPGELGWSAGLGGGETLIDIVAPFQRVTKRVRKVTCGTEAGLATGTRDALGAACGERAIGTNGCGCFQRGGQDLAFLMDVLNEVDPGHLGRIDFLSGRDQFERVRVPDSQWQAVRRPAPGKPPQRASGSIKVECAPASGYRRRVRVPRLRP